MNIIIYYQHITRELASCYKLKEKLEEEIDGASVSIYSIDFEYFKSIKDHKKQKVDIIFMPWLAIRENYYYLMPFLKKNPKLITINLHHEQIGSKTSFDVLIPKDKLLHNIYHFCWGDFFAQSLQNIGVSTEFIKINGNIRSDQSSYSSLKSKDELSEKYGLDKSKKWILFAESRDWVWTFGEDDIEEMGKNDCNLDDVRESIDIHKKDLLKTYDDFKQLPNKFFEEFEIIYRPHPGTISPIKIDTRVKVLSKHSIYDWINACDFYMCSTSTSIFEAEMMGKIVMICEDESFPEKYQMFGLEKYYNINTILNFNESQIDKAKQAVKEPIYPQYIGKCDGNSVQRTVQLTKEVYNDQKLNMEYIDVPKKFFLRKRLYEFATKLSVKSGLFSKIKFPRSAYRERNDIPFYKDNTKI